MGSIIEVAVLATKRGDGFSCHEIVDQKVRILHWYDELLIHLLLEGGSDGMQHLLQHT